MSSVILANPFISPPPPPPIHTAAQTPLVIVPAQGMAAGSSTGSTASHSGGSGSGSGHAGGHAPAPRAEPTRPRDSLPLAPNRPPDATPRSILAAQVEADEGSPPAGAGQSDPTALPENFPFHKKLPKVRMPDPLPTSPFLKQA
ncbi:hypothetical protein ACFSUD_13080 [Sulfitobacter aestuarii]|uniref:Uncharacterized protein n=1 Tax=Sulfitobacter aestuarii TaxID=2161676 RepID=A0ABW5U6I1_9RHOB